MNRLISFFSKKRQSPAEWIEGEASQMNFGLARVYKYEELKKATNNFDKELGKGGYGRVYLGKLQDGKMVAVKVLFDHNPKRLEQIFNEVTVLSRLRHKNLVSLYGCTHPCRQELLLVYEYVSNGTVADHLHKKRTTLTWAMRVQIAVETAEALEHLHALNPLIIHRDVNTSNILLDDDFHAKVADLGICRLLPSDSTHVLTEPQGTMGYRDPEYQNYFRLTDKTDVYSFGVVLMELISGQQAVDVDRAPEGIYLVDRILNKKLDEFVDPILGYHTNNDVRRMIDSVAELAINCLQLKGDMRPPMLHILTVLKRIQNEKHPMEHRDGRQEEIHAKGIQHEKEQKDTNSFDPQQELRDESLNEIYRGVEEAKTDCKSRVVVKGKEVDPIRLCDTVQKKAGRKVELISPLPNPPEEEKEETKDPTPEVKKEEPKPNTVLLKIRMHCEACAQDLKKQIKKTEGVESVVTDLPNHQVIVKGFVDPGNLVKSIYRRTGKQAAIVQEEEKQDEESEKKEENTEQEKQDKEPEKKEENTRESEETEKKEENTGEEKKEEDGIKVTVVKGKEADPIELCDTVQKKAGRKVELISPLPNPPEEEKKEETKDPPPEVKMEEPKPNTVLLKIQMHCEACARDLKRRIKKIEGIESVVTDLPNHHVIVKGFVDLGKLVENIYKRTGKQAAIVQEEEPEKKEENTEEKQDEEPEKKEKITEVEKKAEEPEKREESTTEEKKKKELESKESKKKEENTGEEKKEEDGIKVDDKELEYRPPIRSPPQMFQAYARLPPPQMFEEDAHQMFSDENPNACSLM